jgi:hypothetical protein
MRILLFLFVRQNPDHRTVLALVLVCRATVKWLAWHKVIIDLGSRPRSFSTISAISAKIVENL